METVFLLFDQTGGY